MQRVIGNDASATPKSIDVLLKGCQREGWDEDGATGRRGDGAKRQRSTGAVEKKDAATDHGET
jgi:hypothetical protein